MVPKGDVVVLVGEGDHPLAVRLRHRKEVLEDVAHSGAQLAGEVVQHQVRVGLRHGAHLGNVVPHDGVQQLKVGRGAKGQVADHQAIRFTSGLVEDDKVGDGVSATALHQLLQLVVAAVDALRVGDDQFEFLVNLEIE